MTSIKAWAVPLEVTEVIYVIVHAHDAAEAREKAEARRWADTVPRGEILGWQVVGPPERQKL